MELILAHTTTNAYIRISEYHTQNRGSYDGSNHDARVEDGDDETERRLVPDEVG
jgi:hypothetical protein